MPSYWPSASLKPIRDVGAHNAPSASADEAQLVGSRLLNSGIACLPFLPCYLRNSRTATPGSPKRGQVETLSAAVLAYGSFISLCSARPLHASIEKPIDDMGGDPAASSVATQLLSTATSNFPCRTVSVAPTPHRGTVVQSFATQRASLFRPFSLAQLSNCGEHCGRCMGRPTVRLTQNVSCSLDILPPSFHCTSLTWHDFLLF